MNMKALNVLKCCSGVLIIPFIVACSPDVSNKDNSSMEPLSPFNVNVYKLNTLVCDPFGGGSSGPQIDGGIKAELYYLAEGQERYKNVQDYIDYGTKSNQNLFFTDINVPTRLFDTGFPLQTGEVVKNDLGEDLFEYFALNLKTIIQLGPDDEEGEYELALLSDDGALLKVRNENGEYEVIVNNDSNHPTRMGCGTQTVNMTHETELVSQILYYQGPRHHISLIPMWRKVEPNIAKDPLCGATGNSKFFDYNNNSKPQKSYKDLLARGWKPLSASNYQLPMSTLFNPCVLGEVPIITDFQALVDEENPNLLIVNWVTDIPATSQVRFFNPTTGAEFITDSDNILRTQHILMLDLRQIGAVTRPYMIQGVSISDSYGKAISSQALQVH